jgi:hypothetical protein
VNRLLRFSWVFGLLGGALFLAFASWLWLFQELGTTGIALGVASSVSLLMWAWLDQERVSDVVSSRAFVHGSGSNLLVLIVAVLVGAMYGITRQHDHTWDITSDRTFTLSGQTVRMLEGLEEPLDIYAFYRKTADHRRPVERLVERYRQASDAIEVRWVDPIREPEMARKYEVASERGTLILVSGERRGRVDAPIDETLLTNELVRMFAEETHRVCWSVSHGEPDPTTRYRLMAWV